MRTSHEVTNQVGGGTGILLVEDNPGDAYLIRKYLSRREFPSDFVKHVESVGEARALAEAQSDFLAVLLDLNLPDSTGRTSFERVAELFPGVPVVILTGHADRRLARELLEMGAYGLLHKDEFTENSLFNTVYGGIMHRGIEVGFNAAQAEVPGVATRIDGLAVLVVEDQPQALSLPRIHLECRGARVEMTEYGAAGIRKAASGQHALVVLDLGAPDLDPSSAVSRMRSDGYEGSLLVLTDEDREVSNKEIWIKKPAAAEQMGSASQRLVAELRKEDVH